MREDNLAPADKPRERMVAYGPDRLKDYELLAIMLRSGVKGMGVMHLAKTIIRELDKKGVDELALADLRKIKGIGLAKACEILACFELGKRRLKGKQTHVLLSPEDVWSRMEDIRSSKKEHFVVFYLDSRSQEIRRDIISIGTLNETLVHPREVFEQAIKQNAASVMFAHNHPSGDESPSAADIDLTKRLADAGRLLDIEVIDHVIVTTAGWRSILRHEHD